MSTILELIESWDKLREKATPGQWVANLDDVYSSVETADGKDAVTTTDYETGVGLNARDAAYIAHINPANAERIIAWLKEAIKTLTAICGPNANPYMVTYGNWAYEVAREVLAKLENPDATHNPR
jgi:hypothetical protein